MICMLESNSTFLCLTQKSPEPDRRATGLTSQMDHLLVMWSWARSFTCQCLPVVSCKMGTNGPGSLQGLCRDSKGGNVNKHSLKSRDYTGHSALTVGSWWFQCTPPSMSLLFPSSVVLLPQMSCSPLLTMYLSSRFLFSHSRPWLGFPKVFPELLSPPKWPTTKGGSKDKSVWEIMNLLLDR